MFIKLLTNTAKVPTRGSIDAAGYDIYADQSLLIEPKSTVVISTGIAMAIPSGYYLKIEDRSSMAVKGIFHGAGIIDADYRGEIKIVLHNSTNLPYLINVHDRICQAILMKYHAEELMVVNELPSSERGFGGFGSTGK